MRILCYSTIVCFDIEREGKGKYTNGNTNKCILLGLHQLAKPALSLNMIANNLEASFEKILDNLLKPANLLLFLYEKDDKCVVTAAKTYWRDETT